MTYFSENEPQVQSQNDESLRILSRALTLSQGKFSLILANCQYRHVRDRVVNQLQHQGDFEIQCFNLPKSAETLYSPMADFVDQNPPKVLMVFGLDQVEKLIAVLKTTNQLREEFRKHFPFPIVLWVNRQVKTAFIRSASDFESWSTTVQFLGQNEDLRSFLVEESDRIFSTLLEVGSGLFLDNRTLGIQSGGSLLVELETARSTLQDRGIELDAKLAGSLAFICGRAAVADEVRSRQHYEHSIELLKTSDTSGALERLGCVQHHLGVWWRTYSVDHRAEHDVACERARDCFQAAIATFKAAQRSDLVARFTEKLGEVLQRLEDWEGLKQLVVERLELHPTYPDLFRQARTYGFRAELALAKGAIASNLNTDLCTAGDADPVGVSVSPTNLTQAATNKLTKAKEWALEALQLLDEACETETIPTAFDRAVFLDWHNSFLRGWYRFALGRAHRALGETAEAIQALEQARHETNEAYDPPLCISILRQLRQLYFAQGDYLQAFEIRLAYRSIEQQYGYQAFVGAGRLRAKKAIANPGLARVEAIGQVSTEISASGRQQDVERLIGRLQRSDQKLIVLHGQSGVGKSSIIQAGLIPALTPLTVDGREVAVVLQQVYTPWDKQLGDRILETLRELGEQATAKALESSDDILQTLEQTVKRNFMAVLILDQFEEFFFVYKDPTARKLFYQFLHACLDIPYVKVVLSLREDYLHYLLECNNRLVTLDIINNNILDKDILFYLGNFSPDDAKSVIEGLTGLSQFSMEADLVDALVQDLAQELGEVRPIELQVVGNQLQTEDITTLDGYEEKGPKEALVGRFLEEIVTDCGPDNAQIAKLVLYLLTDENNTRPLKTRTDLELELDVESGKLDLILALLVKSRLVFLIPASPDDRYQLVHDYLVPFVREQQSAHLIAEIEREREQRKLTQAKLDSALEKQLHTARRAMFTLAGLVLAITGFSVIATIAGINTYLTAQTTASSTNTELERVVSALRTAKNLKRLPGVIEETRLRVLSELNQAISSNAEVVHLEGHIDEITHVDFSPDGQNIISSSKDATIKLWELDGSQLFSLNRESGGHKDVVNVVRFSPDGQLLISGGKDKTIKIWERDGVLLQTLEGHTGSINDVQFSPDGELIASASDDKTIKIWNLNGSLVRTFEGHKDRVTKVQFSPDGEVIGSGSEYDMVRLWSLEGKPVGEIESYDTIDIQFRPDNETIVLAQSNGDVDIWNYKNSSLLRRKYVGHFTNIFSALSLRSEYNATIDRDSKENIFIRSSHDNTFPQTITETSGDPHYVGFSPDNEYIVISSQDNIIKLRNLQDLFAFPSPEDKDRRQVVIRYIQDSNAILSEDNNNIVFRDRNSLDSIGSLDGNLPSLRVIPENSDDLKFLRTSPHDHIVSWNIEEGITSLISNLQSQIDHIRFSGDDQRIMLVEDGDGISIWNRDGSFLFNLENIQGDSNIEDVYFHPNNERIIGFSKEKIYIWDLEYGELIKEFSAHDGKVKKLLFIPGSEDFLSIGNDNLVRIWNSNGTLIARLVGHTNEIEDIAFSNDGDLIASRSSSRWPRSEIKLWNRKGVLLTEEKDMIAFGKGSLDFSPDSKTVLINNPYAGIRVWDFGNNSIISLTEHIGRVNDVIFTSDNKLIISAGEDSTIRIWDRNGSLVDTRSNHTGSVEDIAIAPDNEKLISFSRDNTIRLWSISEGKAQQIDQFQAFSDEIEGEQIRNVRLKFSEDGNMFACGFSYYVGNNASNNDMDDRYRYNYVYKIFSTDGDEIKTIYANKETSSQLDLDDTELDNVFVFSDDLTSIYYIDRKDDLEIVDINGNMMSQLKGHADWINSIDISEDGKIIVSGSSDKTIKIWDENGLIETLEGHAMGVNSVSLHPENRWIVSGSDDKTIFIWSNSSSDEPEFVGEHTDVVSSVVFSPNGKLIASASEDNTVQLWDVKNHQNYGQYRNNSGTFSVNALRFSADNGILSLGHGVYDLSLYFYGSKGIWFKETELTPINTLADLELNGDRPLETIAVDDGLEIVALGLDALMEKACNRVRGYLKNSSRVEERDRNLCDGIGDEDIE